MLTGISALARAVLFALPSDPPRGYWHSPGPSFQGAATALDALPFLATTTFYLFIPMPSAIL